MSRNALSRVSVGAVDNSLPASVSTQPEDAIVQLGNRVRGDAADFIECTLNAGQREIRLAGVVPNLGGIGAKQPQFAVVHNEGH